MSKLTDTQLVLLSASSQRAGGVIPISERLKGCIATSVGQKLIALGFAEEQVAMPPLIGWRENAAGQRVALVITAQGLAAVGIEAEDGPGEPVDAPAPTRDRDLPAAAAGRTGTKKAQVISMLQQDQGASIDDLVALTGWLPHTTRAALTGLRKAGMMIEMTRQAGSATRYQIAGRTDAGEA